VQVDPIKPKLKPPGTTLLKLNCDILLSTYAFKFNLRRYTEVLVCPGLELCKKGKTCACAGQGLALVPLFSST